MACQFLNRSLSNLNLTTLPWNWSECYKSLDQYSTDEELAQVHLFLDYPAVLLKFSAACFCIFMIIGIPGNIITIVALSRYRKVRNATAIFIINLSISDLLFALTILPLAISMFLNQSWISGKIICRISSFMKYALNATSVLSIVAITINRYVIVSHPLHYQKLYKTRNLIVMIIAIWVAAFSMLVPTLSETWGRFSLNPKSGYCTIIPDENHHSPKVVILTIGFIFPSVIIIACYSRIMYLAKKSSAKSSARPPTIFSNKSQFVATIVTTPSQSTQEDENYDDVAISSGVVAHFTNNFRTTVRRRERKLLSAPTKRDKRLQAMIVAIMITFFMCHLPITIAKTLSERVKAIEPYANVLGYVLLYMTVCTNPIIYVVMSKEYRQAYKSVFGFLWKHK